jgi:hypothetical protein
VPERTAQLYMRLARHKDELADISATVADLTIRGAIEALVPEQQLEIWPLPRSLPDLPALPPRILTRCADCGLGTIIACENYWVRDFVWGRAWADRLKPWHKAPGQQVLCIACLEHRIGRQLIRDDFVSASDVKSDRLAARLNSPTHALDDWRTASRQRDIT